MPLPGKGWPWEPGEAPDSPTRCQDQNSPTRSTTNFVASQTVFQIVREYNEKIADLLRLTADLPARFGVDIDDPSALTKVTDSFSGKPDVEDEALPASPGDADNLALGSCVTGVSTASALMVSFEPVDGGSLFSSLPSERENNDASKRARTSTELNDALALHTWAVKPKWIMQDEHSRHLAQALAVDTGGIAQRRKDSPQLVEEPRDSIVDPNEQARGCMWYFMAPPGTTFRICWELCGFVLILYDLMAVPLTLSFEPPDSDFTDFAGWVLLFYWTLNVPVTLTTGYISHGIEICKPAKVFKLYCRTWL